ncbi:MAG: radical SAM protein [Deltaproteobacteria bacterium]|nr:MAG: radical SAM protein [Deltaproteobacteria bacterium]
MAPRTLDFRDHRRELDDNRYVYAVVSRRSRGLSIGINLNPDKVCNFACPYCQVDRRTPGDGRAVDPARLEAELDHLLGLVASGRLWTVAPFSTAAPALRRVNDIAWAGDGEPTTSAAFADSIGIVDRLRRRHGLSSVSLHLLTNATLLHRPTVAAALDRFTEAGGVIWGKLDAGTQACFERVDGTTLPLSRVVSNLALAARRWRLVLQCMFVRWEGVDPTDDEVSAWADRIAEILDAGGRIEQVQVYSVARRPADPRVAPVPASRLEEIAAAARALGVDAVVYPGVA